MNFPKRSRTMALLLILVLSAVLAVSPATAQDEISEFVFAHPGPIRTMDAPVTWFGSTHWLTNLMYDCLIWRAADGNGYVGQAAERWENIDDLTWRFYLRPDQTFHNGEVLDAEAVKWNIDRVRTREDFLVYPQWQFVTEVNVIDDLTLDIKTAVPYPYFEYDVSFNGCQILPRTTWPRWVKKNSHAVRLVPARIVWSSSPRAIATSSRRGMAIGVAALRSIASSTR